jgi:DNA-binding transcriptional ArsR family regulator
MARLPQKLQAALDAVCASAAAGECSASLAELARPLGVSGRTMRRRLMRLEARGYLRIERLSGRPSVYRLTPKGQGLSGTRGFLRRLFARKSRGDSPLLPCTSAPLPPSPLAQTVGRQEILATLRENVAKRRPTLLVGPLGIGKSHILREFRAGAERCLYLEHISPIKPALLNLAQLLHQGGALEVEGIEAKYMEWEDVRKRIAPRRINQLTELVMECMQDQDYILILDHLERVTPTMLPHLDALMGVALVIGAADELRSQAQRLWWAFERIEVPPLAKDEARRLLWQVAELDRVKNPQLFETRVLQQSGGNPLAIITMAARARTAALSDREIRGLQHGAGTRYVALTPILLILGALVVATRFVALGLNDRDLYVLAGLGYASFSILRYFVYRLD